MKLNFQTAKETLATVVLGLVALCIIIGGGIWLAWYYGQQPKSCNVAVAQLYGSARLLRERRRQHIRHCRSNGIGRHTPRDRSGGCRPQY